MSRILRIAAAQSGPVQRADSRGSVVKRMLDLMEQAKAQRCDFVNYTELALTTFFPRWYMTEQAEIDSWFEREMPNAATRPLFERAAEYKIGFSFGYAELTPEGRRFNTSILVDRDGRIVGKYRKVHLPGHADHRPHMPYQHLEKHYFEVGDMGFGTWELAGGKFGMAICNDRRWPETYRVMALQGAEIVVLGYNTPTHIPWEPVYDHLSAFHNHLVMQASAYQNSMYVVGVAKAGKEEGSNLLAGSCIVAPSGEIIALAQTAGDEVIVAKCDLDIGLYNRRAMFNFVEHRQVQHYTKITDQM